MGTVLSLNPLKVRILWIKYNSISIRNNFSHKPPGNKSWRTIMVGTFWRGECHMASGVLVSWPGIVPMPMAVKVPSPNHWTTREFQRDTFLSRKFQFGKVKNIQFALVVIYQAAKESFSCLRHKSLLHYSDTIGTCKSPLYIRCIKLVSLTLSIKPGVNNFLQSARK